MFKTNLNGKSRGRYKSEEQKVTLGNIKLLYESRQAPIKLFIDYSPTITEAKYKTICWERIPIKLAHVAKVADHPNLKILSSKQMFQWLPIAFAQEKTRNTSEELLNEIRQIIYFLSQAKEITKKIYNNVMNSIKL